MSPTIASQLRCAVLAAGLGLGLTGCPGPDPLLPDAGGDWQRLQDALSCQPNNDGQIDVDELAFRPGLSASYRVNPPGTLTDVDVAGKIVDGKLRWEFTSMEGIVVDVPVQAIAASDWYAGHFPGASFAVGSDATGETLQLFRLQGNELLLLGLASRKPDWTLLVYDPPVLSLRFPLRQGDSLVSRGSVQNGKLNGLPIATEDTYQVKIDAAGTVRLPFVDLHNSLRVSIQVTSTAVGGARASYRQAQWFHECYGEVVRAVSQRDEPLADFSKASELRRLSF